MLQGHQKLLWQLLPLLLLLLKGPRHHLHRLLLAVASLLFL
jgi:hypothetical protein